MVKVKLSELTVHDGKSKALRVKLYMMVKIKLSELNCT